MIIELDICKFNLAPNKKQKLFFTKTNEVAVALLNFNDSDSDLEYAIKIDSLLTQKVLFDPKYKSQLLKYKSSIEEDSETDKIYNLERFVRHYSYFNRISFEEALNSAKHNNSFKEFYNYFVSWEEGITINILFKERERIRNELLNSQEIDFLDKHIEACFFPFYFASNLLPWQISQPPKINDADFLDSIEIEISEKQNIIYQRLSKLFVADINENNIESTLNDSIKDFLGNESAKIQLNWDYHLLGRNVFFINCNPKETLIMDNTVKYFEVGRSYWGHYYGLYLHTNKQIYLISSSLKETIILQNYLFNCFLTDTDIHIEEPLKNYFYKDESWNLSNNQLFEIKKESHIYHEYFHKWSYMQHSRKKNPYSLLNLFNDEKFRVLSQLFIQDYRLNEFFADFFAFKLIDDKYSLKNFPKTSYDLNSDQEHKNKRFYNNYNKYSKLVFSKLPSRINQTIKNSSDGELNFYEDSFWSDVEQEFGKT